MRRLNIAIALLVAVSAATIPSSVASGQRSDQLNDTSPQLATDWTPTRLYGEKLSSSDQSRFKLSLGPGNRYSKGVAIASTTDNEYRGFYQAEGDLLRIRFESATAVATKAPGTPFMKALRETAYFKVHGSTLGLFNPMGTAIASFVREDR
jgi:hypothetical protein